MDNKGFTDKASRVFEGFKEVVRNCKSIRVSALTGVAVAGPALFVNTMADARVRDMAAAINGYMPPMSDKAIELNELAVMGGVGIAGATFTAILLAKWAVSVSDRLKELDHIKTGGTAHKARGGLRGATRNSQIANNVPVYELTTDERNALEDAWAKYDADVVGTSVQPLIDKGIHKLQVLSAQNDQGAQLHLGRMYLMGVGVTEDCDKARALFEDSMSQGSGDAAFWLAEMYRDGFGVKQDQDKARRLLEVACERGSDSAIYRMGNMYEAGRGGFEKDLTSAERCYERAALTGNSMYLVDLNELRSEMKKQGIESESKTILEQRAGLGDPLSQYKLGALHYSGVQVPKSYGKAAQYLFSAAAADNASAMNMLGQMYLAGDGLSQSVDKGLAFLERAAGQGDNSALLKLADLYEEGAYVKVNSELAQAYRNQVTSDKNRVDIMPAVKPDQAIHDTNSVSAIDSFFASNGYSGGAMAGSQDTQKPSPKLGQ